MFRYRGHRVGEGMRLRMNDFYFRLIVTRIGGTRRYREADVNINVDGNEESRTISYRDEYILFPKGIKIRIRDEDRSASNKVNFNYFCDRKCCANPVYKSRPKNRMKLAG